MRNHTLCLLVLILLPLQVEAYVGPGAGITFLGALIGFFVTLFVVLIGLLAWPIRSLLNKRKMKANEDNNADETDKSEAPAPKTDHHVNEQDADAGR